MKGEHGPIDPRALILQPLHLDCRGCREAILALSRGRTPMSGSPTRQLRQTSSHPALGWTPDAFGRRGER